VSTRPIRRALLAVYDKEGIVELARALRARDVQLVSSGGTAATLRTAGIDVTEASGCPAQVPLRVRNTTFSRWRDPHRQRRRPEAGVMESNG